MRSKAQEIFRLEEKHMRRTLLNLFLKSCSDKSAPSPKILLDFINIPVQSLSRPKPAQQLCFGLPEHQTEVTYESR